MIILLLIFFTAVIIVGRFMYLDGDDCTESLGVVFSIIGVIGLIISIIATIVIIYNLSYSSVIDDKIVMYEEENKMIESQIDELVKNYMDYESETFIEFKSESSMNLISLYPELNSSTLVYEQINTYINNNNSIKALKEDMLAIPVHKWWLFFGK